MVALVAWLAVAALVPASAPAQVGNPFDHLKCYKIKDPTKAKYVADLVPLQLPPFQVEPGCSVKFPAKLFCIPVQKKNVQPAPPGAVNGAQAQDYLLYQIKCPNTVVVKGGMPLPVTDQFGARTVNVFKHQFLLVPAFKQSKLCHNTAAAGLPPVCGGDCTDPAESCALVPGTTSCDCQPRCSIDVLTGDCRGTCPHTNQACALVPQADGTVACTCDPIVDDCHLVDPVAKQCGGPCDDPAAECVLGTSGICECIRPCGPTGIRQCGGLCPNTTDTCRVKPDDSGCECVGVGPTPCGFIAGTQQCGGVCPINLTCLHTGPVPGGQCACGHPHQNPN
jgi:hypothetical protein